MYPICLRVVSWWLYWLFVEWFGVSSCALWDLESGKSNKNWFLIVKRGLEFCVDDHRVCHSLAWAVGMSDWCNFVKLDNALHSIYWEQCNSGQTQKANDAAMHDRQQGLALPMWLAFQQSAFNVTFLMEFSILRGRGFMDMYLGYILRYQMDINWTDSQSFGNRE